MKKYMLGLGAMAVAAAAMAFTATEAPTAKQAGTQYQFNGSSMSEVYDVDAWAPLTGSGPGCDAGSLPCVIDVGNSSLQNWLNARSEEEIVDDALTHKL